MTRVHAAIFLLVSCVSFFAGTGYSEANGFIKIPTATGKGDIDILPPGNPVCFFSGVPTALTLPDPSYTYPFGLVEFTLDSTNILPVGAPEAVAPLVQTTVQLTFTGETDPSGYTYRKYGPTPGNPTPHWYDFMYDAQTNTGAVISGNSVTLYFVDGQRGDDDLTINQITVDQGGAGRTDCFRTGDRYLGSWSFRRCAGFAGIFVLRRRRAAS